MGKPVSPLSRDHVRAAEATLARVLKGEPVSLDEVPDGRPEYACAACQDTAFVVEKALDGTLRSRRCGACRARVDAETKKNRFRHVPGADTIDDEPAPKMRDFKQAAGLDRED